MSGLASQNDVHYGATNNEQEAAWNEEDGGATLLNFSSSSRQSGSLRASFVEHLRGMNSSIRDSAGNLIRQSVTLSFGGRQCSIRDVGGTASIGTEFFNLVKNLVGAGMLAIPVSKEVLDKEIARFLNIESDSDFFCLLSSCSFFDYLVERSVSLIM